MKKLFVLMLAIIMILSLAACGGEAQNGDTTSGGDPIVTENDIEDLEDAIENLETLIPDGWEQYGNFGSSIYDVWDSEFLPDCFPSPIDGVKVEQTTFKDYGDDVLSGSYYVGPISYEKKEDYREYGLIFNATEEQLAQFIATIEVKGLTGGMTDDGTWQIYYYCDKDWFMEIYSDRNAADEGYASMVTVSATDSLYERPTSIAGIPLPQCGIVTGNFVDSYYIYDENYDEVPFDLAKDRLPDTTFVAWFDYYITTANDAKNYAQTLVAAGWELQYEYDGEEGSYTGSLFKDGIYAIANYMEYDMMLQVGFSDIEEALSY